MTTEQEALYKKRANEAGLRYPGGVHSLIMCDDPNACPIHGPSDHHMKDWPLNWRGDTGVMERICPHGVGHPDPDHLAYVKRVEDKKSPMTSRASLMSYTGHCVHGCDGCCNALTKDVTTLSQTPGERGKAEHDAIDMSNDEKAYLNLSPEARVDAARNTQDLHDRDRIGLVHHSIIIPDVSQLCLICGLPEEHVWHTKRDVSWQAKLEDIGDMLEGIARSAPTGINKSDITEMFAFAWKIKQIARRGTPSEGI